MYGYVLLSCQMLKDYEIQYEVHALQAWRVLESLIDTRELRFYLIA